MKGAKNLKIKYFIVCCLVMILASNPLLCFAQFSEINNAQGLNTVEPTREDLEKNENSLFYSEIELSEETKDYLAKIDGDITLTLLAGEKDYAMGEYVEYYHNLYSSTTAYYYDYINTLKTLAEHNEYINVQFMDPFAVYSQCFLEKHKDRNLQYGDLLVTCYSNFDGKGKTRNSVISAENVFKIKKTDSKKKEVIGLKAQEVIIEKIKNLRDKRDINVAYISDLCSEVDIKYLETSLKGSRYNFDFISLKDSKLGGYDMILIAAPIRDVTLEEIIILDSFLENNGEKGKSLIYFAPKNYVNLQNLYSFFKKWGLSLNDQYRLVSNGGGYFADPTQLYCESARTVYTAASDNKKGIYVMDSCTPIGVDAAGLSDYNVKVLMSSTSDNITLRSVDNKGDALNPIMPQTNAKKYPLIALSQKSTERKTSYIMAAASVDFITTYFALQNERLTEEYKGQDCNNLDAIKSIFEKITEKNRKDKSGLEAYSIDDKEQGIDTTSGLKHKYILSVAFGGVAFFVATLCIVLFILNRRKKSGL